MTFPKSTTATRESAPSQTIEMAILLLAGCRAFSRLRILRSKIRTRLKSSSVVLSARIYPLS